MSMDKIKKLGGIELSPHPTHSLDLAYKNFKQMSRFKDRHFLVLRNLGTVYMVHDVYL